MDKSNELYNTLNDCLEHLLTMHETVEQCLLIMSEAVEQCLADYPKQSAHLTALLETTLKIRRAITIQSHPGCHARTRHQLYAASKDKEGEQQRGDLSSCEKATRP